jgi:hypothetical protein
VCQGDGERVTKQASSGTRVAVVFIATIVVGASAAIVVESGGRVTLKQIFVMLAFVADVVAIIAVGRVLRRQNISAVWRIAIQVALAAGFGVLVLALR